MSCFVLIPNTLCGTSLECSWEGLRPHTGTCLHTPGTGSRGLPDLRDQGLFTPDLDHRVPRKEGIRPPRWAISGATAPRGPETRGLHLASIDTLAIVVILPIVGDREDHPHRVVVAHGFVGAVRDLDLIQDAVEGLVSRRTTVVSVEGGNKIGLVKANGDM